MRTLAQRWGMDAPKILALFGCLAAVGATDVLSTSGFQECGNGVQDVNVTQFRLSFDRESHELVFAVAGESKVSENVTGM